MPSVSLVSTLHDAAGWSIEPVRAYERLLRELYDKRLVVVTRATNLEVVDCLEASGWELVAPKSNAGVEHISDSRRRVVRAGVANGAGFVHLADMDRILHWASKYPDELRDTVTHIPENDFTIIGRTVRAMKTHPKNQVDTESIANRVFSLIYGHDVDITAASRGISKAAAEVILRYSQGRFFDSDSEWPTILLCKSAFKIGYIETDGLEWETRLKREEMALPGGKRVDVKEYYEKNPESWVYRAMLAHRIAETALSTYRGLGGAYRADS
jgi:hypothetical protein